MKPPPKVEKETRRALGMARFGPRRSLADEEVRAAAERYAAGVSLRGVAAEVGVGTMTLWRAFRRLDLEVRPGGRRLTDGEAAGVCAAVRAGRTVRSEADRLGVDRRTAARAARLGGVAARDGRPPTCEVDHSAFDVLTPEAAYWVGFLMADGCVTDESTPAVVCGLAERDRGHLEKFRAFLKSTHAIVRVEPGRQTFGGASVRFSVRSKQIAAALAGHGFVRKKSERRPCPELEGSRDFWRGMVDGDGSIGIYARNFYLIPQISLCGQLIVVQKFCDALRERKLADLSASRTASGIWQAQTSGRVCVSQIARWLYAGTVVALDRKLAVAEKVVRDYAAHRDSD